MTSHYITPPSSPQEKLLYNAETFLVPDTPGQILLIDKQTIVEDDVMLIHDLNQPLKPLDEQPIASLLAQKDLRQPGLVHYTMHWTDASDDHNEDIARYQIFDIRQLGDLLQCTQVVARSMARSAFYKASTYGNHCLKMPCPAGSYAMQLHVKDELQKPRGVSPEIDPLDTTILKHLGLLAVNTDQLL